MLFPMMARALDASPRAFCVPFPVTLPSGWVRLREGLESVDVGQDERDPVARALDSHERAVDVRDGALKRGQVRDGRRPHRGDRLPLGLDG